MKELSIKDIINNAKDELSRSRNLLIHNGDAYESWLIDDIDASLERMEDINDRIEFALLIAYHMGIMNAEYDYTAYDCGSKEMRDEYLQAASDTELEYRDGVLDYEWAYGAADGVAQKLYSKRYE